jgi:ABC-2 type transport system permease protein
MVTLKQQLTQVYDWNVTDVSPLTLNSPEAEFTLNDPNVDGDVVVIPGGTAPLSDEALQILTDYLDNGGSVVIFAETNLTETGVSLATAENLNSYLLENFGIGVNSDLIIDQTQAFQTPLYPAATSLDSASYITNQDIDRTQAVIIFTQTHSIQLTNVPPANVTISRLVQSSADAYAKTDVTPLLQATDQATAQQLIARSDNDPVGPFVLAASAENAQTGARVVLFGSTSVGLDNFADPNITNFDVAANSLRWATRFNEFAPQISTVQDQRPQDTPIFAEANELRSISFITFIVLPFGVLAIGILVWWSNRERARTR